MGAFVGNAAGQEAANSAINAIAPREFDQPYNQAWIEDDADYVTR